jgi:uncharacterized protein
MTILQGSLLFVSAMAAGMINSVAGGGTLLTFPSLIWAGHSPIIANATSTVALVPGTWSSMWGYRRELETTPRRFFVLMIPSLIGGILGAALLKRTPPAVFAALVPFLILFATILFLAQEPIQRLLRTSDATQHPVTKQWLIGTALYQFLIAVYGGYFGAGVGILMLAALGLMGLSNIHQMNGLKNVFGSSINAVAAVYFIIVGLVNWPAALLMAAGSIIGGYGAPGLARRLGQKFVRRTVIVIGLAMTISLLIKQE